MTLHVVPAFARIGEENAFAVLARATELQRQGKDIINLGIGQPDFPTPDHIVEAAVKERALAWVPEAMRFDPDGEPNRAVDGDDHLSESDTIDQGGTDEADGLSEAA